MSPSPQCDPIGTIHSPFDEPSGMPIQPPVSADTEGTVDVQSQYADGLADLDGFSHCILLYQFHEAGEAALAVTPFLDDEERGVFATRAPTRPNPIGLSVVGIEAIDGASMTVRGIDVLDGTPLLDVKPFVPGFDVPEDAETGWIDADEQSSARGYADDRFV
ncbi:MAG: tRNA (N6-threonylcarbamoyladenosine(37)-N6)-methyltransferase TrmO [Halorhabdus sp.]